MKTGTLTPRVLLLTATFLLAGGSVSRAQDAQAPSGELPPSPVVPQELNPPQPSPPPSRPPSPPQQNSGQPSPYQRPYPAIAVEDTPGYNQHDGLFFRAILGFGRGTTKSAKPDVEFSGPVSDFTLAAGYAVTENVVLYGELSSVTLWDSDRKVGDSAEAIEAVTSGIGAGLAYYIMPVNVYLSGSLLFSHLLVKEDDRKKGESDLGIGTSLRVGKEWWASANWGLGIYGGIQLSRTKDKGSGLAAQPSIWTTSAATVGFTGSYN